MNKYAVIMAGGAGTRLWPISTEERPKQLLRLGGSDTLLNETIKRLIPFFTAENIFIISGEGLAKRLLGSISPALPEENILLEPFGRNTAACILNATLHIKKRYGDSVISVFPSDHVIEGGGGFTRALEAACGAADASGKVVTIGIRPARPHTGYGYIKAGAPSLGGALRGERFVEKPPEELAGEYVRSGEYYWNAGIFVYRAGVMLELFKTHLPDMYKAFAEAESAGEAYRRIEGVSIDCGVMNKLTDFLVVPGGFKWSDIGSFGELYTIFEPDENGNVIIGRAELVDVKGCFVYNDTEKPLAVMGVSDCVVVGSEKGALVCHRSMELEMRQITVGMKRK